MQSLTRLSVLALPLLAAILPGCRSADPDMGILELMRRGEYEQALLEAEESVRAAPGSERAQRRLREAQVAFLLQNARETLFAGDPEGALSVLESAEAVDPGNPAVAMWTLKVKRQLAEEWLDVANELTGERDLDQALEAYENALRFNPESRQAKLGVSRVLLTMNYRMGQSKSYYNDGLETFRGFLLDQADNNFAKALDYDPGNDRAGVRKEEVEDLLIEERIGIAQDLESEGLYFAARNEYRMALLIDEGDPAARAGYDRMDREVRARRGLDKADMDVRRGNLEQAEETLTQAEVLTEEQVDEIVDMRNQIEDASVEGLYQAALELERDYRYTEAIEAYEELLSLTDGYYADADLRKQTLEDFVARAERLYERVLAGENDMDVLESLREIDVFWPEYRDVPERITAYVERGNDLFRRAESAGSAEEALGHLRELASFWPGYPGLEEWLQRLEGETGE